MRIRLTGTYTECEHTALLLGAVLAVREISGFYPNRGRSELGRIYLEVEAPNDDRKEG